MKTTAKIVLPGGSGQVGAILARAFVADGHEVVVLSRNTAGGDGPGRTVAWDGETAGPWTEEIDGADVVVNLAGRSVNCRYHAANRRAILESRTRSTAAVGRAIAEATKPPGVWLQASTATIYAHTFGPPHDEANGVLGGEEPDAPDTWRFSIDVAKAWEEAALAVEVPHTRRVLLRSSVILSPDPGGIFDVLLGMVRRGLGGTNGDGRQYVSWIHDADFVRAVRWLIESDLDGPVNVCSPHPLPNAEFMRTLRNAWGTRLGLPARQWMLAIGAFFLRTETELILKSRRVVPGRLLEAGFSFESPDWGPAAEDLCRRWREWRAGVGR